MPRLSRLSFALAAALLGSAGAQAEAPEDTLSVYGQHCASCHGAERLGAMGPALIPENLGRLKRAMASASVYAAFA